MSNLTGIIVDSSFWVWRHNPAGQKSYDPSPECGAAEWYRFGHPSFGHTMWDGDCGASTNYGSQVFGLGLTDFAASDSELGGGGLRDLVTSGMKKERRAPILLEELGLFV